MRLVDQTVTMIMTMMMMMMMMMILSGVALTFEKLCIANAQHGKNYVSSPAAKATISTDLAEIDKHENTNIKRTSSSCILICGTHGVCA